MDMLEQIGEKFVRQLEIYDCLLVESGGRCGIGVYMDEHLYIAQKCISVTGTSDYIVNIIDKAIIQYSSDSCKQWKYRDLMLKHLQSIKDNLFAL